MSGVRERLVRLETKGTILRLDRANVSLILPIFWNVRLVNANPAVWMGSWRERAMVTTRRTLGTAGDAPRRPGSTRARRHGAVAVEFAMLLPVLTMSVFATIDFGRAIMVMQLLTHAASVGARAGVLPGNGYDQIKSAVNTSLTSAGITNAPDPTVSVQPFGTSTWTPASSLIDTVKSASPGDAVKVTLSVPYGNVSWISGVFLSSTANLTSGAVMGKE